MLHVEGQNDHGIFVPLGFVDVWFSPAACPEPQPESLGLLGRMAVTSCLIEPFRNQPTPTEVRNCLLKLFLAQADLQHPRCSLR